MTFLLSQDQLAEDLLGSKGRVRILRALTEDGSLNHSQICRRVGMKHGDVNRHLDALKELGMIREKRHGFIRMFEIAFDELHILIKRNRGIDVKIVRR